MKKIWLGLLMVLISFTFVNVYAKNPIYENSGYVLLEDDEKKDLFDSTCADFSPVFRMGGIVIFLVQIALPLVIIVKSSLNLYSVVTNGSPEELKKKFNKLIMSCLAGAVIFFMPILINTIFNFVDDYREGMTSGSDAYICRECVFSPFSETCSNAVKTATEK